MLNRPSPKELPTISEPSIELEIRSTVRSDGGANTDIKQRLSKARAAFNNLQPVWKAGQYNIWTTLKLYNSCILPILLYHVYGSEYWRMTEVDQQKISTLHTKSLSRILRIFWPQNITNQDLLIKCKQEEISIHISRRRWSWIAHVLRKSPRELTKTAMFWTPEGKRGKETQRTT
ncbi:uncharacterized protein [Mytilus edulis]|uniref:uncharacterized protein n=1 Tax=Mytilus edulis TaxID=6550 RepID=UPI0039F114BE